MRAAHAGTSPDEIRDAVQFGQAAAVGPRAGGQLAGGDRRGQQSAAVLVVRAEGGYGGYDNIGGAMAGDDCSEVIARFEEAGLEAQAVLAELMALLPERKAIPVPMARVVVDADKCAACLTCYRACPHGAIQPNTSQHRMDILDPACWQCGICAAVCPGRALKHESLRQSQIHEVLQVATRDLLGRQPIIAFACRQSAVLAADAAG